MILSAPGDHAEPAEPTRAERAMGSFSVVFLVFVDGILPRDLMGFYGDLIGINRI
jgi:hypothetical protein